MILGFGLKENLNEIEVLKKLDQIFLDFLKQNNIFSNYRQEDFTSKEYSDFLIQIAPYLDDFLAQIFNVELEVEFLRRKAAEFDIIYECKRKFVQRFAIKKYPINTISKAQFQEAQNLLFKQLGENFTNEIFAAKILLWQRDATKYIQVINAACIYSSYMISNDDSNILFNLPKQIDLDNLITPHLLDKCQPEVRFGFSHINNLDSSKSLNETKYCIYCHKQDKDSCSKGFKDNETNKTGCPLKQKISEMNYVSAKGFNLAALAIIAIDNPMMAVTGYRICNDCTKSCIFQKQEAVDIPFIESNILQTVLKLPWGFEIYHLLTRWNPLNLSSILPQASTGYNVLVVGLGPAGFALTHYLLNSGHNVVGIDGLKIDPLTFDPRQQIKYWDKYKQNLAAKIPQGFGGVAEYGITSRWDKNNLTLIRIILERHKNFKIYSSVRFGSNISMSQAFLHGFDHIAMCTGAGAPRFLKGDFFSKGVKTAAEFLMSLQSSGAFLQDSNANLVMRLPVAVIGCGLTAIDAAVEAINYYPLQVEKFLKLYEDLIAKSPKDIIWKNWNKEEQIIANEFISHAKLFRTKTPQEIRNVINQLGGVTIYYHNELKNSAAYKLNHEEMAHAYAAGIKLIPNAKAVKINQDKYGYTAEIEFEKFTVKAKTVLVAIGTTSVNKIAISEFQGCISYYGDANPLYSGSVVKALASAKYGHGALSAQLKSSLPTFDGNYTDFIHKLDNLLISRIKKIDYHASKVIELIIHSPSAAQNFQAGQFFKLQNYSLNQQKIIEATSLTGVECDPLKGTISFLIEKIGRSSMMCQNFKEGEVVALMGPIGQGLPPLKNEKVLLIGSNIRNLLLISIAKILKENNCEIIHLAHYDNAEDKFYKKKIEQHAKHIIWSTQIIPDLEHIIGSCGKNTTTVISAISEHNSHLITEKLKFLLPFSALIHITNTSMQCMMQGVCGQCIISSKKAETGYIFSCRYHSLDSKYINLKEIQSRLTQNSVQEKLSFYSL